MVPWFLLYPAIGAALGAGGAKVTGRDWTKGAMLGAGLGLGAGALAPATAGGAGGWGALTSKAATAAGTAPTVGSVGMQAGMNAAQLKNLAAMNLTPAELATASKGLTQAGAAAGAKGAAAGGWGQLAKQAAVSTALGGAAAAAMPKYGQTQLMVNPGFLQPMQEDPMMQLQNLMSKKGRVV